MKNFSFKTKKSSPRSSHNKSIFKIVGTVVIAICFILLLRSVVGTALSTVSMKVLSVRTYFQTSGATLPVYIRDRKELHTEIARLKEALAAQSGGQSTIARLSNENEALRSLLSDSQEERILAGVIARPPAVPYDLLVIDRGTNQGIVKGALVYHEKNHVIGIVSRVYSHSALVTLFSSAGAETTVYVYGPDIFAYAYGEGGGVIRISVPQGITLTEGDSVVLPSIHAGDLGIIERIVSLPTQPEQNAYLTFPVPIQSLRSVAVAKTAEEPRIYEELVADIDSLKERFRIAVPDHQWGSTSTPSTTQSDGVEATSQ